MRVTKLFLLTTLIISGAALMGCTKKAESNKNADPAKKTLTYSRRKDLTPCFLKTQSNRFWKKKATP